MPDNGGLGNTNPTSAHRASRWGWGPGYPQGPATILAVPGEVTTVPLAPDPATGSQSVHPPPVKDLGGLLALADMPAWPPGGSRSEPSSKDPQIWLCSPCVVHVGDVCPPQARSPRLPRRTAQKLLSQPGGQSGAGPRAGEQMAWGAGNVAGFRSSPGLLSPQTVPE